MSFEVIVVDDCPTMKPWDICLGRWSRRSWILLKNRSNLGRAASRNIGIRAATGKYILLLDDDMWAIPDLLQAHYEMQQKIGGGVVVGAVPPSQMNPKSLWNRYTDYRFKKVCERLRIGKMDYGLFLTGNVSIPKTVMVKCGGFNENFKEYSFEDSELGLRLMKMGIKFAHAERAIGHHFSDESLADICRKAYQHGRSLSIFVGLHPECAQELNFHSLKMCRWRGRNILKNLAKLLAYNEMAVALNKLLAIIMDVFRQERAAFYLISLLRYQYSAKGLRSMASERGGIKSA